MRVLYHLHNFKTRKICADGRHRVQDLYVGSTHWCNTTSYLCCTHDYGTVILKLGSSSAKNYNAKANYLLRLRPVQTLAVEPKCN